MVVFVKSTVSLLASVALLSASVVNGRALEAVELVERTAAAAASLEQRSDFRMIHIDPETHSLVHGPPAGFSKRHFYFDERTLLDTLRHHDPERFCKAYAPSEYAVPSTRTIYVTKTTLVPKIKTKTTTGKADITTETVQGSPSLASTVTKTDTITSLTTLTVDAPTQTIDVLETLTISEAVTLTSQLPEETITSVDVETATVVLTATGPDVTVTVGVPQPTVVRRHDQNPSWLASYTRSQIVNACLHLVPPPHRATVTQTAYKTVTTPRVIKTCKVPGKKSTKTTTVHAAASTVTTTDSQTLVSTIETTATPLATETITTQYTTVVTVIETSTPPTQTEIQTSFVTTTTTATVAGATHTACANQASGLTGGGVSDSSGSLNRITSTSAIDCCSKCFDMLNCTGWEYFGACYIGRENAGGSPGTATPSCPNGKGGWVLFGGSTGIDAGVGGPGPCTGDYQVQRV